MRLPISRNFLWTLFLAVIWMSVGVLFGVSVWPYYDTMGRLFVASFGFIPAFIITLLVIRYLKGELVVELKKQITPRSTRVQHWLESLDDDELDALRDRLQTDVPEQTLEALISKPKRR